MTLQCPSSLIKITATLCLAVEMAKIVTVLTTGLSCTKSSQTPASHLVFGLVCSALVQQLCRGWAALGAAGLGAGGAGLLQGPVSRRRGGRAAGAALAGGGGGGDHAAVHRAVHTCQQQAKPGHIQLEHIHLEHIPPPQVSLSNHPCTDAGAETATQCPFMNLQQCKSGLLLSLNVRQNI